MAPNPPRGRLTVMIQPAKGLRFCIYTQMFVEGMRGSPGFLEGFLFSCSGGSKFCFFPESTIWESAVRSVCILSPEGKGRRGGKKMKDTATGCLSSHPNVRSMLVIPGDAGRKGAGRVQAAALGNVTLLRRCGGSSWAWRKEQNH